MKGRSLLVFLVSLAIFEATSKPVQAQPKIIFTARIGCVDSGINVSIGESINFSANGLASYGYEGDPVNNTPQTNADGNRFVNGVNIGKKIDSNALLANYPIGILIGRIGRNGRLFPISSDSQMRMSESGRLFLCYNDVPGHFDNNSGAYTVTITSESSNTLENGRSTAIINSRQELVFSNLGCTRNLRTILGQSAPDYCTSADVDSKIIFDELKPTTRNADGSIKLEMTILNRGSADGFVEVYDSRDNLVNLEVIESSSPPTDLIRNINPFDERSLPASFFSNYPIGDLRRSLKRQNISVIIPAGGYAKVTKYGNISFRYNAAMLALELAQAAKGDPEFVKSEPVKEFIKGFAKEAFLASDSKAVINIFKSSPSLQAQFNMNVIDPNKLAKVLQELVEYSVKIEKDPSKNPFIGAFQDVFLDGASIGLENAVNLLLPGLGTFASGVRKGGNYLNTLARAADLYYAMASGEKATVTIRDAVTTGRR